MNDKAVCRTAPGTPGLLKISFEQHKLVGITANYFQNTPKSNTFNVPEIKAYFHATFKMQGGESTT